MKIINKNIDNGKAFDWGETSLDYARFRDIYPQEFYQKIMEHDLCIAGQSVLDIGTGAGVLPRNMYQYGAKWTAADISERQIEQAKILSKDMDIDYYTVSTENLSFPDESFDVITACQCFVYFDQKKIMPILSRILKRNGRLLLLYMSWLPFEDEIAGASENLVSKYNPKWTGAGQKKHPIYVSDCVQEFFEITYHEEYDVEIPFTRETWNGRVKACRGVGASLSQEEIEKWEIEHQMLLQSIAPNEFYIKHYVSMLEFKKRLGSR